MKPITVLLVDDSAIIRRLLARVLDADPDIVVGGTAGHGQAALDQLGAVDPDVVVLDIEMPVMDGLQVLPILKRRAPDLPVIMFSTLTERGASATLEALTQGADDYVTKPSNTGSLDRTTAEITETLVPRIKALVERARARGTTRRAALGGGPAHPTADATDAPPARVTPRLSRPRRVGLFRPEVVAVAVSTGGPDALGKLVPQLPADLRVPVLITQHMPPIFTRLLAERLDEQSAVSVAEGVEGAQIGPGQVWIAPGGSHMLVRRTPGGRVLLTLGDGPPVQSCKPAADPMFTSCVDAFGGNVLGVVLTGMGSDGHHGAERVRDAGGRVICQDEATSVVWGMPGVVARAGLAEEILALEDVPGAITAAARLGSVGRTAAVRPVVGADAP